MPSISDRSSVTSNDLTSTTTTSTATTTTPSPSDSTTSTTSNPNSDPDPVTPITDNVPLPTQSQSLSPTFQFPPPSSTSSPTSISPNSTSNPHRPLRPKRSGMFYPTSSQHANSKPFARSAQKRESVQLLGSIASLQHLYSKQGIASRSRPSAAGGGTLAIGLAGESLLNDSPPSSPTTSQPQGLAGDSMSKARRRSHLDPRDATDDLDLEDLQLVLPPSPEPSTYKRPPYPIVEKPVEADHIALRPLVIESLETTCQRWGLLDLVVKSNNNNDSNNSRRISAGSFSGGNILKNPATEDQFSTGGNSTNQSSSSSSSSTPPGASSFKSSSESSTVELVSLMKITSQTIRLVRNYLFALPPDSFIPNHPSNEKLLRSNSLSNSNSSSTSTSTYSQNGINEERRLPNEVRQKDKFKRQSSFSNLPRVDFNENRRSSASASSSTGSGDPKQYFGFNSSPMNRTRSSNAAPSSWNASPIKSKQTSSEQVQINGFPGIDSTAKEGSSKSKRNSADGSSMALNSTDPLVLIRSSALEVLGMLRNLEEKYRIPTTSEDGSSSSLRSESSGSETDPQGSKMEKSFSQDSNDSNPTHNHHQKQTSLYPSFSRRASNYSTQSSNEFDSLESSPFAGSELEHDPSTTSKTSTNPIGYLYQENLTLDQLEKERGSVKNYIEIVNLILSSLRRFKGHDDKGKRNLWTKAARRERRVASDSSTLNGTDSNYSPLIQISDEGSESVDGNYEEVDQDLLPDWASLKDVDQTDRLYALLLTSLPPDLCLLLSSLVDPSGASPSDDSSTLSPQAIPAALPSGEVAPSTSFSSSTSTSTKINKEALLLSLSDGEMLCLSYNSILRRSRRPWGFIPSKDIHFLSREGIQDQQQPQTSSSSTSTSAPSNGGNKKDWTFRRLENLRVWSAALRLRYNIHSSSNNHNKKLGLGFDPKIVARKEDGWMEMLEEMVGKWLNEVIEEVREEGVEN